MTLFKSRLLACAFALCATPALAGTLAGDGSSYLGTWHGTTGFQGHNLDLTNSQLTGTLDYAVYAPGTFPAGFLGYTPTLHEFVYAYQGFETGAAPLSSVSINLVNPADNIGTFSGGGVSGDPSIASTLFYFDNANWLFNGVPAGGSTTGLVFSSPNVPMMSTGSTIDDGTVGLVFPVPSPDGQSGGPNTPEPATLTLALIGMAAFALHRVRRRKRVA
jgi:MYXO-CTERM domain-containing protein